MIPRLTDLLQVCAGAGLLIGAIIGLAMRAKTDTDLVSNIVAASTLGAIAGTAIAFSIWFGGTVLGGR